MSEMEYTRYFDCGCKGQVVDLANITIQYCPMHKAAPALYEALEATYEELLSYGRDAPQTMEQMRQAIALVEGK